MKDSDDLVHDHEDPDHRDKEANEAQDDTTGVTVIFEAVKCERADAEAASEGGDWVPPRQLVRCPENAVSSVPDIDD